MKVKRYEHLFLHWAGYIFAVLAAVSVAVAKADTIPQPMTVQEAIARTPNNQNFSINVHNNTGTYTQGKTTYSFNVPNPNSNQFGKVSTPLSDPLQGGKQLNVVVKDPYGNTARGTINTQTQLPANNTINQMAGAYLYGAIAGGIVNSPNAKQAARDLAQGNYGSAAANAAASFDVFHVGSGLYGLFDEYANAKAVIANPMHDAAKAKAEQAAAEAQAAASQEHGNYQQYLIDPQTGQPKVYPKILHWYGYASGAIIVPKDFSSSGRSVTGGYHLKHKSVNVVMGTPNACRTGCNLNWTTIQITEKNYNQYKDLIEQAVMAQAPQPTINDFLLNQAEIQAVIANALNQMLNNQQENTAAIKDLVNLLWQNGQLNPTNTQTTVTGTTADNTFLTAPYTPQGSNQAQQTQFVINPDGTMTTSIIPRPDLAPNTAQAPTRQIVNHPTSSTQSSTQNQQTEQGNQQAEQQDFCKQNPNSLMCAEMQEVGYEDVKLPNEQVNVEFKPADLFAENGVCPQPKQIAFYGNTYFLSYEPMCDFATGARPMIILLGIVIAMSMVYATVKEM